MNGFGIYTDPGASVTEAGFGGRLPTIGDVVMMKDDAFSGRLGYAAFTTSIIVDIRDHDKYPDAIMIHLARPHMRAEKIGCCRGNAMMMMEQHQVETKSFCDRYVYFTQGASGEADNRGSEL